MRNWTNAGKTFTFSLVISSCWLLCILSAAVCVVWNLSYILWLPYLTYSDKVTEMMKTNHELLAWQARSNVREMQHI